MMEFTLSRVVLAVCGVLLLGAVIAPFAASEDNAVSGMYQEEADVLADVMDEFYNSTQSSAFIDVGRLLPNDRCSISFKDRIVTISDGEHDYSAACKYTIEPDSESYDSNDVLFLKKGDGKVIIRGIR